MSAIYRALCRDLVVNALGVKGNWESNLAKQLHETDWRRALLYNKQETSNARFRWSILKLY